MLQQELKNSNNNNGAQNHDIQNENIVEKSNDERENIEPQINEEDEASDSEEETSPSVRCKSRVTNYMIFSSRPSIASTSESPSFDVEDDSIESLNGDEVNLKSTVQTSELYPISVTDSLFNDTPDSRYRSSVTLNTVNDDTGYVNRDSIRLPSLGSSANNRIYPEELINARVLQDNFTQRNLLDIPRIHGYRENPPRSRYLRRDSAFSPQRRASISESVNTVSTSVEQRSRPSTGANSRNLSAATCRSLSSSYNRPHSTGLRRASTSKIVNPSSKLLPEEGIHLPPGGADCLPGCGYSGLPCYVCSTKGKEGSPETEPFGRRLFGFRFRSSRRTPSSDLNVDEPRRTPRQMYESTKICCKIMRNKCRLPRSRTNQCILTVVLIYMLLCIQFVITGFMAGSISVS